LFDLILKPFSALRLTVPISDDFFSYCSIITLHDYESVYFNNFVSFINNNTIAVDFSLVLLIFEYSIIKIFTEFKIVNIKTSFSSPSFKNIRNVYVHSVKVVNTLVTTTEAHLLKLY